MYGLSVLFKPVPIIDLWGPYAKLCHRWWGVKEGDERIDETHLSTFHSISNSAQEKCSKNSISSPVRFVLFIFHARDCTVFTLHNLTEFLHREGTANHIKINEV